MRLATIHTEQGLQAVRVEDGGAVEVGFPDVGALLREPGWQSVAREADGRRHDTGSLDHRALIPAPGKVICVGLNYRNHILEMGHDLPEHPALFAKFPEAIIGDGDPIELSRASMAWDWEVELAVVIGAETRRADRSGAEEAIAGFSIINDVTARDFQNRSPQWLQGKTFEHTAPLGPVLVTPDEVSGGLTPAVGISCSVDGQTKQQASTAELVFGPAALVEYISAILTLRPGDVIATGTPGGVGHARTPPHYLVDGSVVVSEIDGIGRLENRAQLV